MTILSYSIIQHQNEDKNDLWSSAYNCSLESNFNRGNARDKKVTISIIGYSAYLLRKE